jgi:uncharacterized membrane protein YoaK (UPF0700 family)
VAVVIATLSGDAGASHGMLHLGAAGAFGSAVTDVLACLLAAALGIQNAVARKLAVPDMTTTVLTMTLTGLGADLRAVRRGAAGRAALGRRLLVVVAMVAGGAAGAVLVLRVSPLSALALATALLAVAALGAATVSRGAVTRHRSGAASWRAFPAGKS